MRHALVIGFFLGWSTMAFCGDNSVTALAPYWVVDLSGGKECASYEVRASETPPDMSVLACRTTQLWLRLIQPGSFVMGSPEDELGHQNDEYQHRVVLTHPYYMGVFEVTQAQWERVMGENPSIDKGDTRPVGSISYADAVKFLKRLSEKTARSFGLPTESQWEYACRAGTTAALNSGKNLSGSVVCSELAGVGRYYDNQGDGKGVYRQCAQVGSYAPNAWGLYDMHGNLSEWCSDWYGAYPTGDMTDPTGLESGGERVARGGGWCSGYARYYRSACRFYTGPTDAIRDSGMRVAAFPMRP